MHVRDYNKFVSVSDRIRVIRDQNLVINRGIFVFWISGTRIERPFFLNSRDLGQVDL